MSIKIYQKGERVLRRKTKEVPVEEIKTEKIQKTIKKIERAITEQKDALAVAAPQVGESWRIFVISEWALNPMAEKDKQKNMVFINPRILGASREKTSVPESCLSAPLYVGKVRRAHKVRVEAYDENGKKFVRGASGLLAQAIQHELDHLDGVLFTDKAENLSKYDAQT